jgi:hypothetical protein
MTKIRIAKLRQEARFLRGRRASLERIAMGFVPMLPASLLERRFRKGGPPAYYLSIPHPKTSRHRYVRKANVDMIRRQTDAWREFSQAMAQWVRVNDQIERLLRQIGDGRCRKIDL